MEADKKFGIFALGIMVGAGILGIILSFHPQGTRPYMEGVRATQKEAFENGLMTKEVDKDDNVIYRWVELHKLQEQDN